MNAGRITSEAKHREELYAVERGVAQSERKANGELR